MLLAALGTAVLTQLNAASISIVFAADSASVEASYEFTSIDDSSGLTLIRLQGQELHLTPGGSTSYTREIGLYRIQVRNDVNAPTTPLVRYSVSGGLSRVPIPVPEAAPRLDGAPVLIQVFGLGPTAAWSDAFPRLEPQADGSAIGYFAVYLAYPARPDGRRFSDRLQSINRDPPDFSVLQDDLHPFL
jgi:hypothetical protein